MNHHYSDIRSLTADEPLWWDENAVPRYCEFAPRVTANIYAVSAVLLLIECQNCSREFKVCMTNGPMDEYHGISLRRDIEADEIHYGDPPNAGCCPAGPTMNSVPRRVIEYWDLSDPATDPVRVAELERPIRCDWAEA